MVDREHMPTDTRIPGLICYEDLVAGEDDRFDWPEFDARTRPPACATPAAPRATPRACSTATRSTVLHTFASALPDALKPE